jgi:hypothetical protein
MSGVAYTTSDALGGNSAKTEWVDNTGKKYQVELLTLANQSKFERFLEKEAVKTIRNVKDELGDEEYLMALDRCLESIAEGKYSFGGEDAQRSLGTFKGMCAMISILFNTTSDDAFRLVKESPEIPKVIENIVVRSFPAQEKKPDEVTN